jgi:hypothetical protein
MAAAVLAAPSATALSGTALSGTAPYTAEPTAPAGLVDSWKDARVRVAGAEDSDGHPAGLLRLPELGGRVSRANALAGFAAGAAMSMPVYPTLTLSVTAWPR